MKVCIEDGCWEITPNTRCAFHQSQRDRARYAPRKARYMKRAFRDAPITTPCECCAADTDLTRHHITPTDWVSMCRRCNSSIADRTMADNRCPMHGGKIL